ncbi:DUF2110 domain-containing protein [Halobacteriales archaeon QH_10_67_13]|nr:MAG: DUF2110 domain-containing protein [Halobacteriales archaeon QH_10_67_13]
MVVLATKCYVAGEARDRAIDSLRALVDNDVGELEVDREIGIREDDFPTVTVTGPDATAARNLLRERWGAITPQFEAGETYVGTLAGWDEDGLTLDAGREVTIPRDRLGLGPGGADQVRRRYGLVQHTPLAFVSDEPPRLADRERDRLYDWERGSGRVNVNSATRGEVRATVNRAGHAEDIVTVERLGLLEQSIVCREGTDSPGLLASIGEYLPAELLCVV